MKQMTLRDIQMESLEILKEVHKFCVANDINYSLAYGTLIGSIRHKGFIPWDDDLDIIMLRPDYEKFCRTFKANGYEVVSRETRKDCLISFARVCDTRKTYIKTMEPWIRNVGDLGVWIDIFPIDSVPDDFDSYHKMYLIMEDFYEKGLKKRKTLRPFTKERPLKYNINTLKKKVFGLFSKKLEYYLDVKDEMIKSIPFGSTSHMSQLACPDQEIYFDADIMNGYHLEPFEDSKFYVIDKYDEFLKIAYGNYMELPPEDQRQPQQNYVFFYWKD